MEPPLKNVTPISFFRNTVPQKRSYRNPDLTEHPHFTGEEMETQTSWCLKVTEEELIPKLRFGKKVMQRQGLLIFTEKEKGFL